MQSSISSQDLVSIVTRNFQGESLTEIAASMNITPNRISKLKATRKDEWNAIVERLQSAEIAKHTAADAQTSILIHEIAHAVHYSLSQHETNHIKTLYESRPFFGRDDAYAQKNEFEYFAEGVTAYFNAGMPPEPVKKRSVLQTFDPPLFHTMDGIFEKNDWL